MGLSTTPHRSCQHDGLCRLYPWPPVAPPRHVRPHGGAVRRSAALLARESHPADRQLTMRATAAASPPDAAQPPRTKPMPNRFRALSLLVAVALVVTAAPRARADAAPLDTSRCEAGTRARLDWLVDRLESRETYADLWWRGWISFYGLGVVIQSARAGVEDDDGEQADLVVSAVKAVGGVTRLYFSRPTARLGADPIAAAGPLADEAACQRAVAEGESLLRAAAEESDRRWSWTPHLTNVAVNTAGALIVAEGFDEDDGWTSAAVGIAVGEAMLWTHPWKSRDDLAEYEARFVTGARPGPTWALAPYERGLQVQVRF